MFLRFLTVLLVAFVATTSGQDVQNLDEMGSAALTAARALTLMKGVIEKAVAVGTDANKATKAAAAAYNDIVKEIEAEIEKAGGLEAEAGRKVRDDRKADFLAARKARAEVIERTLFCMKRVKRVEEFIKSLADIKVITKDGMTTYKGLVAELTEFLKDEKNKEVIGDMDVRFVFEEAEKK